MPIKFTAEEERIIMRKTLVDANKIKAVKPCIEPVDGDLVRVNTDVGRFVDGAIIAICCHYTWNPTPYYVSQDGTMYSDLDVEVLEIIGECVFSVYV